MVLARFVKQCNMTVHEVKMIELMIVPDDCKKVSIDHVDSCTLWRDDISVQSHYVCLGHVYFCYRKEIERYQM